MNKLFLRFTGKYEHELIILFLITVGLLKLPSFYIFTDSTFTSTHTISKVIIIGLFFIIIFQKKYKIILKNSSLFLLLLFLLVTQSLTIINAIDANAFLKQYQNLVIDLMVLIIAFMYIQSIFLRTYIVRYIYFLAGIIIAFELFFLFLPSFFIAFFTTIIPIQKEFMDLYVFNFQSLLRINLFLHSELFFPFFLEGIFNSKNGIKIKGIFVVSVFFLFIISLSSKFRTRLVQSLFAIVAYLISSRKNLYRFILITVLFSISAAMFILFREINNHTIFDRILAPEEREDVETLSFRRRQLNEAFDHFKAYPLFGVGLGNYKSYMSHSMGIGIRNPYEKIHYEVTVDEPHSIFIQLLSETGILGILSYGLLLAYFLIHDLSVYRKQRDNRIKMMFIIASWTVFLYGIMNPFNTVFLNGWFWLLRGITHGFTYNSRLVQSHKLQE